MAIAPLLSNFAQNTRPRAPRRPAARPTTGFRGLIGGGTPTIRAPKPAAANKPPAAAAPAPAAPAASLAPLPALGPTPLPPDASYEQQVAAAAAARDQTLAGLTQQRYAGLQEFGYTEAAPGQVQFDANNAFSRAALLRKHYVEQQRGNVTGMASRGQLYSGALQNQQDYATRGFNEGDNSLQRALIAFLSQNTGQGTQAQSAYQQAVSQAEADRVARAQQSALYDAQMLAAAQAASAPPADAAPAAAPAAAAPAGGGDPVVKTIANYKSPSGKVGTLHIHASGKRVFVA